MTPTSDEKPAAAPESETAASTEITRSSPRATLEIIRMLSATPEHKEAYRDILQQLIDAETSRDMFDQDWRAARIYAMSGQFDDIRGMTKDQAIATAMSKIRIGRSMGMNESDSVAFIYWMNGRPSVMTEVIAAKIQQAGYSWDVEWSWEDATHKGKKYKRCTGCTLWLKSRDPRTGVWAPVVDRRGEQVFASFQEVDADTAEIYEKGKTIPLSAKWNFKSWGQDMYFWRAMSRLRKYHLTGIMRGAEQVELQREVIDIEHPAAELPAPATEQTEDRRPLAERILDAEQLPLEPEGRE